MNPLGTPLHVAIVGSGPAGFFSAGHLLGQASRGRDIRVDMFDRLPTPFGLVRFGVAPDHENIKAVTAQYDKTAAHPGFRFFGNVNIGRDVSVAELRRCYHQIIYTTGSETDNRMGIPGEDLLGSHSATSFAWWYNGHPDHREAQYDLSAERVAVVGVGNVAVDVCRILARTPDELAQTDIADHALAALRRSQVKEIYMLGRRGPAQAAFTNPELRELGELIGADIYVRPEEAELDPLSRAALLKAPDKNTQKKVELVQAYAQKAPTGKPRKLVLRFLVSPVELIGDGQGRVTAIRLVRNVLTEGPDGSLRPRATSEHEVLPVSLVFRSVGYFGVALPGVPFDARKGVIPNERGRVRDPAQGVVLGEYTAGWIKRGPSGVIGTNKPDAKETVDRMLEDVELGQVLQPEAPGGIEPLLRERGIRFVSYRDWQHLNELEVARGKPEGRPRVKLTAVEEMLKALERGQA